MLSTVVAVFVGVLVFLTGQLVLKGIIEPALGLKATIARVSNLLLLHQVRIRNATRDAAIAEDMNRLSADILSTSYHIPWFPLSRLLFGLPSRKAILETAQVLKLLHYRMLPIPPRSDLPAAGNASDLALADWNIEAMARIKILLGMKTDYS